MGNGGARVFFATMVIFALLGCQVQPPQVSSGQTWSTPAVGEPDYWPTAGWKSSTPEQQGMDSVKLAAMFDASGRQQLDLHSVLIVRNGYIVAEAYFAPYTAAVKHQVMSVTKSVASMLTGIAIGQGRIQSVSEPVLAFFPDRKAANLDQNKRALTIEHLLKMSTGLDCSDGAGALDRMFASPDWVQFALDLPMATTPGAQFRYCSPAENLLSAILQKATGKSIRDMTNETLFTPLGVSPAGAADWSTDPQGVPRGFDGLSLTPRDMAKLGVLYLQGGRWNGQQIVPAGWVAASLAPQVAADAGRSYGYLFWIYPTQGYYSAMGLGGQDIHIIPAKNMVVVFTAAMNSQTHDREIIKLLDDYVIPAAASSQALPENPAGLAQLQSRIARAAAPQPSPPPPLPALARSVSGKVYRLDANSRGWKTLSPVFEEGSQEAVIIVDGGRLLIGLDNIYRTTDLGGGLLDTARGRWEGGDTFVADENGLGSFMQWQYRLTFPGDQIRIDGKERITGATDTVTGRLAP